MAWPPIRWRSANRIPKFCVAPCRTQQVLGIATPTSPRSRHHVNGRLKRNAALGGLPVEAQLAPNPLLAPSGLDQNSGGLLDDSSAVQAQDQGQQQEPRRQQPVPIRAPRTPVHVRCAAAETARLQAQGRRRREPRPVGILPCGGQAAVDAQGNRGVREGMDGRGAPEEVMGEPARPVVGVLQGAEHAGDVQGRAGEGEAGLRREGNRSARRRGTTMASHASRNPC